MFTNDYQKHTNQKTNKSETAIHQIIMVKKWKNMHTITLAIAEYYTEQVKEDQEQDIWTM